MISRAFYFGKLSAKHHGAGHGMYAASDHGPVSIPDARPPHIPRKWMQPDAIDARLTPACSLEQCACTYMIRDGWTVLAWHDYTGDNRPGSNSVMILEGRLLFPDAVQAAGIAFPQIMARQPEPFLPHA